MTDWSQVFGLTVSPFELIARGTAMYLFLFVLFRVVVRRRVGSIGMADLLILVIIADAAQNGLSGEYKSVTDACILVGTILGWNLLIDWLNYAVPALRPWLEPPPLLLIRDGRIQYRNLRHEFVTQDELKSKLREQGVESERDVVRAFMEPDGQISVVKRQ